MDTVTHSVKALLFDLGGVVLDISFDKALERWSHHSGVGSATLKTRFTPDAAYERHERGEIEAAVYYDSLRTAFGVTLSDEQFEEGWNAIFLGEIPETVALLKRLKSNIPLYAFSNTNAVHQLFWSRRYASALAVFERVFVSSDMGKRKPEREAFEHVAAEIGVGLENILFFDDTEANVTAARALAMQAVLVTSPDDVFTAVKPFL